MRSLALVLLALCGPALAETEADILAAVQARRAAVIEAYNAGDLEGLAANYTEDAWHISPRRPPTRGRDGLKAYFGPAMRAYLMSTKTEILDIDVNGDTATVISRSTLTGKPRAGIEAPEFAENRLNLSVFKRQDDGAWLIHRFIDTTPAQPE